VVLQEFVLKAQLIQLSCQHRLASFKPSGRLFSVNMFSSHFCLQTKSIVKMQCQFRYVSVIRPICITYVLMKFIYFHQFTHDACPEMNTPTTSQNVSCAANTQKCGSDEAKLSSNPFLSYCEEVGKQENDKMFKQPRKRRNRYKFADGEVELSGEASSSDKDECSDDQYAPEVDDLDQAELDDMDSTRMHHHVYMQLKEDNQRVKTIQEALMIDSSGNTVNDGNRDLSKMDDSFLHILDSQPVLGGFATFRAGSPLPPASLSQLQVVG
jgi:hypothetical protein